MRVLIVDDDAHVRNIVRLVLERDELQVVEAASAAGALEACEGGELDVAVVDLNLPDQSGMQLMSTLHERQPHLPVIILTGMDAEDALVLALDGGAHDYVVKPFSNRELVARVLAAARRPVAADATHTWPQPTPGTDHSSVLGGVPNVVICEDRIVHANDAALELLQTADRSRVIGMHFLEFVAPQSARAARRRADEATHGEWPRPERITLQTVDGVPVELEVASLPVVWEGKGATQVTLWESNRDEPELQALATGVHAQVSDAVIVTDLDLFIHSFNPAAEALYGWTEVEAVGRHLAELLSWQVDPETARQTEESFRASGRWHGELEQVGKDGERLQVRSSATMLTDRLQQPIGIVTVNRRLVDSPTRPVAPTADSAGLDIELGLNRGEFRVVYQPVVRLGTGEWIGVEALVRWEHPGLGLLLPGSFIGRAEQSGAIVPLGTFVLEEACQQWARWHERGLHLHVAVNLSGLQLADPDLPRAVSDATSAASMPPQELWLEVTETSLVEDLDDAAGVLRDLAGQGTRISIDDFGTGWASLTYLSRFPVNALKIDRVFVSGLDTGTYDEAIVSSIVSLGAELGLEVVAEGIETAEQASRLQSLGCINGQGYLFGRPAQPSDLDVDATARSASPAEVSSSP